MSHTIDVPGGQATLRDVEDLTVRQRRVVQAGSFMTARRIARMPRETLEMVQQAQDSGDFEPTADNEARVAGLLELLPGTADEAIEMMATQDAAIVVFLESWTLERALPTSAAMVGDLPGGLYDVLAEGVAPLVSAVTRGPSVDFDPVPNTPENATAPFVESATSNEPSATPS